MNDIHFEIKGQGVIIFSYKDLSKDCIFYLYDKNHENELEVKFSNKVEVQYRKKDICKKLVDENNNKGLIDLKGAYYWFSLDSKNQKLYAGIGEARLETKIYEYTFSKKIKYKEHKDFLESLSYIKFSNTKPNPRILKILKDPITTNIPLVVKNTNNLTMLDVAKGTYLPKSNLSHISQQLYDCISGTSFILDDDDFPDFTKAIEYSYRRLYM